ncbi:hypothetical protein OBBRIDRAFT_830036 [Obba rivulosa]|uniref:Uncharacterized protein n=1 Tax=Obba rivulosa TaxID=1052685 RepID=A0A8E2DVW8_9APHY|nr:hypothetical protein OBBRIDRAFT_830036 [Obba rivulosa]
MRSPVVTFSLLAAAAVTVSGQLPGPPIPKPKLSPHMDIDTLKFLPGTPQAEGEFHLHTERQLAPSGLGIGLPPSTDSAAHEASRHNKRIRYALAPDSASDARAVSAEAERDGRLAAAEHEHDSRMASAQADHDAAERARAGDYPHGFVDTPEEAAYPDTTGNVAGISAINPSPITDGPFLADTGSGLDGGVVSTAPAIATSSDGLLNPGVPVVSADSGDVNGLSIMNGHVFNLDGALASRGASGNGAVNNAPGMTPLPSLIRQGIQKRRTSDHKIMSINGDDGATLPYLFFIKLIPWG